MVETYPCPICGKEENRRGRKFTDKSQTAGHIDGAHDRAHKDVSPTDVEITPKTRPDGGTGTAGSGSTPPPDAGAERGGSEPTESDGETKQGQSSDQAPPALSASDTSDSGDESSRDSAENDEDSGLGIVGAVVGLFVLIALLGGDDNQSTRRNQPF